MLGTKGLSRSSTVVHKYNEAIVQRTEATGDDKLVIETFSGVSDSNNVDGNKPQYPVAKLVEDTLEVTRAADGSGTVTFELDSDDVTGGSVQRELDSEHPRRYH